MNNDRELLQQALDALEDNLQDTRIGQYKQMEDAANAIRARLTQPEQEPVAWYYAGSRVEPESVALDCDLLDAEKANCIPLYTAPPQREWQRLTDQPVGWIYEDDEGRMMFSQMPHPDPLWEPVYRKQK